MKANFQLKLFGAWVASLFAVANLGFAQETSQPFLKLKIENGKITQTVSLNDQVGKKYSQEKGTFTSAATGDEAKNRNMMSFSNAPQTSGPDPDKAMPAPMDENPDADLDRRMLTRNERSALQAKGDGADQRHTSFYDTDHMDPNRAVRTAIGENQPDPNRAMRTPMEEGAGFSDSNNAHRVERSMTFMPDLIWTTMNVSTNEWTVGNTVVVELTEENIGSLPSIPHYTQLYLSDDMMVTSWDRPVGPQIAYGYVLGGGSQTQTVSFTVPDVPDGDYYIGAIVDIFNAVNEFNEANNGGVRTGAIHISRPAGMPDLAWSAMFLSTDQWTAGESVTADLTEVNTGTGAAHRHLSQIYLSENKTITKMDTPLGTAIAFSSIEAGGDQTQSRTLMAPSVEDGDYYVGAIVDVEDWVNEVDEGNNGGARTGTVSVILPMALPDLMWTYLSVSTSEWMVGTRVAAHLTVENPGASAAGSHRAQLYLSGNETISTWDTPLGAPLNFPSISPGEGNTQSAEFDVPSLMEGVYYMGALVDIDDDVQEKDEDNNGGSRGGTVRIVWPAGTPDLTWTTLSFSSTNWGVGNNVTATLVEENHGVAKAVAHKTQMFLSTNTTITIYDVPLGTVFQFPPISAGGVHSEDKTFVVPEVSDGDYYVGAFVDIENYVKESDEDNNRGVRTGKVSVSHPLSAPDLRWTRMVLSDSTWEVGEQIAVDLTEKNSGDGHAGEHETQLYLSENNYITPQDIPLGTKIIFSGIAAGETLEKSETFSVPDVSDDTYYIGAIVDVADQVMESDEENNGGARSGTVSVAHPAGAPNLVWTTMEVSETDWIVGEEATIDVTEENRGDGTAGEHRTRLYLSENETISTFDRALEPDMVFEEMPPGGKRTQRLSVTTPPVPDGFYHIGALVDVDNNVKESNESDNGGARVGNISVSRSIRPDLVWTYMGLSSKAWSIGESTTLDLTEKNLGSGDAVPHRTQVYISSDDAISDSDWALGEPISFGAIPSGLTEAQYLTATVPDVADGSYYLGAEVDIFDQVEESNETNNGGASASTVTIDNAGNKPDIRIAPLQLEIDAASPRSRSAKRNEPYRGLEDEAVYFRKGTAFPHPRGKRMVGVDDGHRLVRFHEPLTLADRRELAAQGVSVLKYIPNNAYWISMKNNRQRSTAALRILEDIEWSWTPDPEYKIAEAIENNRIHPEALYPDGTVRLHVLKFPDASQDAMAGALLGVGPKIGFLKWIGENIAEIRTPLWLVRDIAALDMVEWIEPASPPDVPTNHTAAIRIGVDALRSALPGLDGSGVSVGVWDGGAVFNHDDFGNRLSVMDNVRISKHSTHVAGTIGGSGNGEPAAMGMAPKVHIKSFDWEDDEEEMRRAVNDEIALSNHSYSSLAGWTWSPQDDEWVDYSPSLFGSYTSIAGEWDDIVSAVGLIVFKSAGNDRNDGPDWPGGDRCDGPYDSISHKGIAKNVITIGATTDGDEMTDFSGWGPADDGRVKPDLCANGEGLYSTVPGNRYEALGGTSMATPSASGAAALLYQHFLEVSGIKPNPATLKALLIHAAKDLGRPGPDYEFGWGLIDAEKSAELITSRAWETGAISDTGSVREYKVAVPGSASEFKATLVWSDPPASPQARDSLVNNLDLVAVDPDGASYYPWVLDKDRPLTDAETGVNNVDNVEQVRVVNPTPGEWTLQVSGGYAVPFGPQRFSIVAVGLNNQNRTVTIYNEGTSDLKITRIEKENGSKWLSCSPEPPFNIPSGRHAALDITVNKTMAASGLNTERLMVYSDDPDESPYPDAIFVTFKKKITPGDFDGDSEVDLSDAILVLQLLSGCEGLSISSRGDIGGDQKISLEEGVFILRTVAGVN